MKRFQALGSPDIFQRTTTPGLRQSVKASKRLLLPRVERSEGSEHEVKSGPNVSEGGMGRGGTARLSALHLQASPQNKVLFLTSVAVVYESLAT